MIRISPPCVLGDDIQLRQLIRRILTSLGDPFENGAMMHTSANDDYFDSRRRSRFSAGSLGGRHISLFLEENVYLCLRRCVQDREKNLSRMTL